MRDHTRTATLTGMTRHRRPVHLITVTAAAAALAVTGCSGDSTANGTDTTPSTSDASPSETTPSDEEVFAAAEKSAKKLVAHPADERIPKGAEWATDKYRREVDRSVADGEKQGMTFKGETTWLGSRPEASEPDAAGGWQTTMHVCSESTLRAYVNGQDVSLGKDGKPLPKGKREVAYLVSFSTPDEGQSWQVDSIQQEEGETCGLS